MNVNELKKKMIDSGFDTLRQLSEASGVPYDPLSKTIRGQRKLRLDEAQLLRVALDLEPEEAMRIFFND